jgi:ribonuclease HI
MKKPAQPNPGIAEPAAMPWQAWFDGSASPNPGKMGIGLVLQAPDGSVCERSFLARESGCNNEAELHALCALLELARDKGARRLQVHGDSDVAVRYANGSDATGIARLLILVRRSQALLGEFEEVSLRWIPRHRNGAADELSRRALGLPAKPASAALRKRRSRV